MERPLEAAVFVSDLTGNWSSNSSIKKPVAQSGGRQLAVRTLGTTSNTPLRPYHLFWIWTKTGITGGISPASTWPMATNPVAFYFPTYCQRCGRAAGSSAEATWHSSLSGRFASSKGIPWGRMSWWFGLVLSGDEEKKKTGEYYPPSASCPRLRIWTDDVWFWLFSRKHWTRRHFLPVPLLPDLASGNHHKNVIWNPCHLITHKSPRCVCGPSATLCLLWPQRSSFSSYRHL